MASVAAASRARHTITLACAPYGAERKKSESTLLREEPGPRAIGPSRQAGEQTNRAVDGFRTGPADPVQPSLIRAVCAINGRVRGRGQGRNRLPVAAQENPRSMALDGTRGLWKVEGE